MRCVCVSEGAVIFTDGGGQLRQGVIGEEEVLQVLTAADLFVHHFQVVLRHVQIFQVF